MAGLDDLAKQAQGFVEAHKDEIQAALQSEKAEDVSDTVLDAVASAIDDVTGGAHTEQIQGAREQIDTRIGTE